MSGGRAAPERNPPERGVAGGGTGTLDPRTAAALQEALRRSALRRKSTGVRRPTIRIRRATAAIVRRWLLLVNLAVGAYVALPWVAPVLLQAGQPGAPLRMPAFGGTLSNSEIQAVIAYFKSLWSDEHRQWQWNETVKDPGPKSGPP